MVSKAILLSLISVCSARLPTYRETVLEDKLNPYSPYDSPFDLTQTVVDVYVENQGLILMEVNDHKRTIISGTSSILKWQDQRLAYDAQVFPNVSVPGHLIWRPPINCANCLVGANVVQETSNSQATITPDGTVELAWGGVVESVCIGNTEKFPFDSRACSIAMTHAFPRDDSTIKLWPTVLKTEYVGTHEWQITYKRTSTLPAGISYEFELARYSTTYLLILVVPAYLVTLICVAANILTPDVPLNEKLGHSITALTALSVLTTAVLQYVPKSAVLSRIGFFILEQVFVCLFTVSGHLLSSQLEKRFLLSPTVAAWLVVSFLAISNLAISVGLFCFPASN